MEFKITGRTSDTQCDIFQIGDYGSFTEGCITETCINVWTVKQVKPGHFKRMLNLLVTKTETNRLNFILPIRTELRNVLEGRGFLLEQIKWETVGLTTGVLTGEWKVE